MTSSERILNLSDLQPNETGVCFVMLESRERSTTREGKPYYRCTFRDAVRSVPAMIWQDTQWFPDCEQDWQPGDFFKIRCRYTEGKFGPQIDLDQIRHTRDEDTADGFQPTDFFARTRFDIDEMFAELIEITETQIDDSSLSTLVQTILTTHEDDIKTIPAATRNHHAFMGGYLEHVLSVTKTAVFLADKYRAYYQRMQPPLSKSLVVAGAILHDIGKIRELNFRPHGAEYTAEGRLVGHILQGRDILREFAAEMPDFDTETLLRLEHIIIAHQNLPEWGSPIAPHTPEALLVHYADDIDAKFQMMAQVLENQTDEPAEFSSRNNPLRRSIFRKLHPDD
ncbi:MAG: HD domain-containing protein [Planctomycetaceae bacterium]